ncbi:hypothetical protein ACIA4I_09045 [Lactobacillus delbrueckii subsp. bulgaricus]
MAKIGVLGAGTCLAIFFQLSCQNPLLVLDVLIDSCQLDGAIF